MQTLLVIILAGLPVTLAAVWMIESAWGGTRRKLASFGIMAVSLAISVAGYIYFDSIGSSLAWVGMKSVGQGAATQCCVAVHPGAGEISGEYWADCNVAPASALANDDVLAEWLWQVSEEIARGSETEANT